VRKNVTEVERVAPLDVPPPHRWNWMSSASDTVTTLQAHWHREREIRRAVAALAKLDDRMLRDSAFGADPISSRSRGTRVIADVVYFALAGLRSYDTTGLAMMAGRVKARINSLLMHDWIGRARAASTAKLMCFVRHFITNPGRSQPSGGKRPQTAVGPADPRSYCSKSSW
jgi:hypothetical protein